MGSSDAFDVSFSSKLLALCIKNMPVTITHLASLSTSLCGRLGPDPTSALILREFLTSMGGTAIFSIHRNNRILIGVEYQIQIYGVCSDYLFENSCK